MRILIADDEEAARYGMKRAVHGEGRVVDEAGDGATALQLIRERSPDLVFLDLNMPVKGGMAVLTELRHHPVNLLPEIIVVTANDTVSHAVECIRLGASDFLTKPFDVDHIRAVVRRSEQRVHLQLQVERLQTQIASGQRCGDLLGTSRSMQKSSSLL